MVGVQWTDCPDFPKGNKKFFGSVRGEGFSPARLVAPRAPTTAACEHPGFVQQAALDREVRPEG